MRGGDSPCFRRVATLSPSLPHQRIVHGLLMAVVDEHHEGERGAEREPRRDHELDDEVLLCSWAVVDDHGRPDAEERKCTQNQQLDAVPQLGSDETPKRDEDGIHHIHDVVPDVPHEPTESVHVLALPFFSVHLG